MPPNNQDNQTPNPVPHPQDGTIHVPHKPVQSTEPSSLMPAQPIVAPSLEDEIVQKDNAMKGFVLQRLAIEEESKKLFSEQKALEGKIAPVIAEEKNSVAKIAQLEKERLVAVDPHAARILETSRWEEEENRRGIEHRKWQIGEELEVVTQKIKEVERTFKALSAEEKNCRDVISSLQTKAKQRDLGIELEGVVKEKVATEAIFKQFQHERERLELLLRESIEREEETLTEERAVDRKTEGVGTLYEEQVLAGERHKLEDARKDAEQKRWEAEDLLPPAVHSADESGKHLAEIKKKESDIAAKLNALSESAASTPSERGGDTSL